MLSPAARVSPPVQAQEKPLRLAIAGLVHGHVSGFLRGAQGRTDVQIVGVYEPDPMLLRSYGEKYNLPREALFTDLTQMLDLARPDAIASFTNTRDHPAIVEAAAPRHLTVMMEKPLAVSNADAQRIKRAADAGKIQVLVNYETTWYASHGAMWTLLKTKQAAGEIRKMVAMDGHNGPKAINVQPEFLDWLSDPVRNGAGALFDFGCYGANLMTWMMDNQRPMAVTAVTQQFQPAVYPKVDDEATILVEYAEGAGDHPGVVELAVQPQGLRGLRRSWAGHRDRRQRAPDRAAQGARTRGHAGAAAGRRARLDLASDRRRPRRPQAERAVVAREQPDRDRDPRRRARVRENASTSRAENAVILSRIGPV